jgi:hypothetical protein
LLVGARQAGGREVLALDDGDAGVVNAPASPISPPTAARLLGSQVSAFWPTILAVGMG